MMHAMSRSPAVHIATIDGLRALAVLAVIAFHIEPTWLPGGFTGVDMFFVISGFVISQALASRGAQPMARLLLDFYRRRALRLLPALLLMLLATFVLAALFIPRAWRNEQFDQTGWAALVGLSNIVLAGQYDDYFSPGAELNPFLHTWTLGVEEQFYLIFPLLFLAWLRGRERGWWARALLPALTVLSVLWAGWQAQAAPTAAFYLLPSRFWELAAGALLYQWTRARPAGRHANLIAAAGLALLVAGVWIAAHLPMPVPGVLATVVGTVLLLAGVCRQAAGGIARVLGWSPLVYLGRLSYALYLWHWPLLVLLRWTYGLQGAALWLYPVLLLAVSAGSYHLVERPLRHAGPLLRWAPMKTLALAVLLVALGGAGAWASVAYHDHLSLSVTRDSHAWQARRYPTWRPLEPVAAPSLEGRRLFVAGDSHAAAYRTMTSMVARQTGMTVQQSDQGGCSFVNLLRASPADCQGFIEQALSQIEREAHPGDFVLLAALRMPELRGVDWSQQDERGIYQQLLAQQTPAGAKAAREEAERVLQRLQVLGVQVVIDAPLPLFKAAAYRCSDWFNRMNPKCGGGLQMARADVEMLRAPQMALVAELAARYPALTVWDPLPHLCGPEVCVAVEDGQPLFFDNDHLSGHGNRVLLPHFRQMLIDAVESNSLD